MNRLVHAKQCDAIFLISHVLLKNILGRLGRGFDACIFGLLDG